MSGEPAPSPQPIAGFVHRFVPGAPQGRGPVLLLLHGTGGDENDLLPLGRVLAPEAPLLSPRGRVLERGMPRFFRRHAEGVFDLEDLERRTHELADFVAEAAKAYALGDRPLVAVGFSNGANIAASLLLRYPGVLSGAALFRAMDTLVPDPLPALADVPVLLSAGRVDPLVPEERVERLAETLRAAGAAVTLEWDDGGHTLGAVQVRRAKEWLSGLPLAR